MSFRVRALLLIILVALTASAATAALTLRQASQQFAESRNVDQEQIGRITSALHDYGERHGTWEAVSALIDDLHGQTGQRIHLATESGTVLVDTDTQAGRSARPLSVSSYAVDPRPRLTLPSLTSFDDPGAARPNAISVGTKVVAQAVRDYRAGVRFAACLTRSQVEVTATVDSLGVPRFTAVPGDNPDADTVIAQCRSVSRPEAAALDSTAAAVSACLAAQFPTSEPSPPPRPPVPAWGSAAQACLARAFTEQIADVAPVPIYVYLGARGDPGFALATGPVLAAVAGVILVVVLGTVLLSHRVLRPIGALTTAARRLGRGELGIQVPVYGSDELAALGRSFNLMAHSLQRSEERQRRLVADVAHELRTPLANLRGYLEALADGVVDPSPEVFASLLEEAVLQQRIVHDLQDLALAEAGKLAYHRVPVDLAELLETCRTAHRAQADSAGVALTVHALAGTAGGPPLVHADPDRLRQLLGNLITNALRATPVGGSVSLHLGRSTSGVEIRVVDTGAGIAADALPFVFDRFWRADPARGRHTGGGLGLAIAKQIITDHGGTIAVVSEVGAGTTFTITLPAGP